MLGARGPGHVGEDTHQLCLLVEALVSESRFSSFLMWGCKKSADLIVLLQNLIVII